MRQTHTKERPCEGKMVMDKPRKTSRKTPILSTPWSCGWPPGCEKVSFFCWSPPGYRPSCGSPPAQEPPTAKCPLDLVRSNLSGCRWRSSDNDVICEHWHFVYCSATVVICYFFFLPKYLKLSVECWKGSVRVSSKWNGSMFSWLWMSSLWIFDR